MKQIFKTIENKLEQMTAFQPGSWINLVNPTTEEVNEVAEMFNIEIQHLRAALDEEERAHVDTEDDYTIIIVDVPIKDNTTAHEYATLPLEIIIGEDYIVTVCLREVEVLKEFLTGRVKTFYTFKKTRFILQILYKNASYFLQYLRHIDKLSNQVEQELNRSMKNKELIQFLKLEKSLVYFSTGLRSNEIVLERMMRMETIKQYPEDTELLEDVIIENKQAIEMANVYSNILDSTMNSYSSVISNNLNVVMKTLTSITIVLSIPTMIFSLYGMNVPLPFEREPWAFPFILGVAVVMILIVSIFMIKKKLF